MGHKCVRHALPYFVISRPLAAYILVPVLASITDSGCIYGAVASTVVVSMVDCTYGISFYCAAMIPPLNVKIVTKLHHAHTNIITIY